MHTGKRKSRLRCAALAAVALLLAGCANLPTPGSLLKPPTPDAKPGPEAKVDYQAIVQALLPSGATLIEPTQQGTSLAKPGPVQAVDLTGDGQKELVAGYRLGQGSVGVLVLAEGMIDHNTYGWHKIWEDKASGNDLALLQPADVTGDGVPELLVGVSIGASVGNGLKVVGFPSGQPQVLAQNAYHRLDVADFSGAYGPDGKEELALWSKDTGTAMAVEVFRYHEGKLIPAPDTYAAYFPTVVKYYQEQLKAAPEAPFLWYYLADAHVKAGQPREALSALAKAAALPDAGLPPAALALVKGEALLALGRNEEALRTFREITALSSRLGTHDQARTHYGLARAAEALGNLDAARADYRKALELDPDWPLPEQALDRLDLEPLAQQITAALERLTPEERADPERALNQIRGGKALRLHVTKASGAGRELITVDFGPAEASLYPAHGLFWWDGPRLERFHSQVFYSSEAAYHGLDAGFTVTEAMLTHGVDSQVEATVIYDSAATGSGSPRPVLYLLRLEGQPLPVLWRILWRSPGAPTLWRNSHGQIRFTGPDLTEFTLEGDSWSVGDGRDNIFQEANPGPHRRFLDTWQRDGDAFRRVRTRTLPSAYATLVELIYDLSTGRDDEAVKLVTHPELLDWARALVLTQEPVGQRWQLDLAAPGPSPEQRGPLTITSGPAAGVTVTFLEKDGQFLVNGFKKDGITFIPGLARAITDYLEKGEIQKTPFGGKVFAAYQLLGTAEKNGEIQAYVWALLHEIVREDTGFKVGSGSSLPLVLKFRRDPDGSLTPVGYDKPGDGAYYLPSIRRLFPPELVEPILKRGGNVRDLAAQIFLKAHRTSW